MQGYQTLWTMYLLDRSLLLEIHFIGAIYTIHIQCVKMNFCKVHIFLIYIKIKSHVTFEIRYAKSYINEYVSITNGTKPYANGTVSIQNRMQFTEQCKTS